MPTLRAVLNSTHRPRFWNRSFSSSEYDVTSMGLILNTSAVSHATMPDTTIYDTSETGYGNQGHTFGDALTETERTAVLEYLKTW